MKHFIYSTIIAITLAVTISACESDNSTEAVDAAAPTAVADNNSGETVSSGAQMPKATAMSPVQPRKIVMGWVERVQVSDINDMPKAKLDSGAKTSSIDAEIIRRFKRDGKSHVVFRVDFGADQGGEHTFEAPVERWVRIKRKGDAKDYIRRPVVKMTFCLGGEKIEGEVNLAERENFIYPVLIGRNMLKDRILVDTSKTFTKRPSCS